MSVAPDIGKANQRNVLHVRLGLSSLQYMGNQHDNTGQWGVMQLVREADLQHDLLVPFFLLCVCSLLERYENQLSSNVNGV